MSLTLSSLTCWCLSANNAGMINQALGLAEAIGIPHETKLVRQGVWWRFLPPRFWPNALAMVEGGGRFTPPWPDVVISCGQRSVATALAIRRASGDRTQLIHVQNPNAPLSRFAFVVAPRHDKLKGPNVLETLGAVHRVSASRLAEAAKTPDARFAHLQRPLLAVLVGGSTMRQQVTDATIAQFIAALKRASDAGVSLAITPSRRTSPEHTRMMRDALPAAFVWDGTGENPYFHLLAQADAILVTGESVSMVSEGCATGKPIYVYELYQDKKMQPLLAELRSRGMIRPFEGTVELWKSVALDDTPQVAATIRQYLSQYSATKMGGPNSKEMVYKPASRH